MLKELYRNFFPLESLFKNHLHIFPQSSNNRPIFDNSFYSVFRLKIKMTDFLKLLLAYICPQNLFKGTILLLFAISYLLS